MSTPTDAAAADVAPKQSHSTVITSYAAVARFRNSQHLDRDARIAELITDNRHAFEDFVKERAAHAQANGVPDCPEIDDAVRLIEQAKDAMGRALIHAIGTCKGVPFEEACSNSMQAAGVQATVQLLPRQ